MPSSRWKRRCRCPTISPSGRNSAPAKPAPAAAKTKAKGAEWAAPLDKLDKIGHDGVLAELNVTAGQQVDVGTVLALVTEPEN